MISLQSQAEDTTERYWTLRGGPLAPWYVACTAQWLYSTVGVASGVRCALGGRRANDIHSLQDASSRLPRFIVALAELITRSTAQYRQQQQRCSAATSAR